MDIYKLVLGRIKLNFLGL